MKTSPLDLLLPLALGGIGAYVLLRQRGDDYSDDDYVPSLMDNGYVAPITVQHGMWWPMTFIPVAQWKTSPAGRSATIQHEGVRYVAYRDTAGKWTNGIGHLITTADALRVPPITPQTVLNEAQVMSLFAEDLAKAENAVKANVSAPLTQGMFDALTDFCFNFGATKFKNSTLRALVNARNYDGAAEELKRWVHSGGKVTPGLVARRNDNIQTFLA